jgi:hypothetical protein
MSFMPPEISRRTIDQSSDPPHLNGSPQPCAAQSKRTGRLRNYCAETALAAFPWLIRLLDWHDQGLRAVSP